MSNSPLVNVTRLSPNCSKPRNHSIDRLTPHHTAGVLSVESALEWFSKTSTQASCNYVVGNDGRIGLCVEEANRPWTSSSRANDNRAITFEVCNSATGGNWPVSDKAFDALVNLCTDICKRYGKKKLLWISDKDKALAYEPKADEMILTQHNWFSNTNCPGPFLSSKFPELSRRVTENLNPKQEEIEMNEKELIELIDKRITAKLVGENTKPAQWIVDSKELDEAVAAGITDGTRPGGYAKREEVAAMVLREHKSVMSKATDAAAEAVKAVLEKIKGVL